MPSDIVNVRLRRPVYERLVETKRGLAYKLNRDVDLSEVVGLLIDGFESSGVKKKEK